MRKQHTANQNKSSIAKPLGVTKTASLLTDDPWVLKAGDTMTGALGVGAAATNQTIFANTVSTNTSGSSVGIQTTLTANPASAPASGTTYRGMFFQGFTDNTNSQDLSNAVLYGGLGQVGHAGSGTLSKLFGMSFSAAATGTGNVTDAFGASMFVSNTNTAALSTATGLLVDSALNTGGGSIATNTGISVGPQTVGTTNYAIRTRAGKVVLNEDGDDSDVRVEGDTDQNLLFTDASVNRVGIGTSTPAVKLDVAGEIRASTAGTNTASVATVGGTQTLTNKTLDNSSTVTVKDTLFTLQDDADITKQARFDASTITTGSTRTLSLPNITDRLIARSSTDILTNKTYDTAGTGNVFKVNGTGISAVTGTGSVVLASSPTITTPTGIVKADVGLGNVDNTSDANKPVSTAQATADGLRVLKAGDSMTGALSVTVPTTNNALVLASTNGTSTETVYAIFNSRARFGYNGTDTAVQIDDNASGKSILFSSNGAKVLKLSGTAGNNGANYLSIANGAAGAGVTLSGIGSDTDVGITLTPKGAGTTSLTNVKIASGAASGKVLTSDASGNATWQTASAGSGDASTNTSTSVDSEIALFSGTAGKTLKRATGTGIAKITSGVLSTATAGTDYVSPTTVTTKGDLLAATAASTLTRLGVGTNGQILTADSTQTTGMKWATGSGTTDALAVHQGDFWLNVKDYGALGNNSHDDTTAINNALTAAANLVSSTGRGAIIFFPAGEYPTSGGHTLPAFCHILGSEPASSYWGYNATDPPRSTCALRLISGSNPTAMLLMDNNFHAGSVRDISLLGNNSGTSVAGINFASSPSTEHNLIVDNVAIIGFSGNGVQGRLFATRWNKLTVVGCHGYGLNCSGSIPWTDSWFTQCIINGNVLGGINFDSTGSCGLISFTSCRIERSGWDPANPTTPVSTNSPGIRIHGNLFGASFTDCSTDANSGNGLDIIRTSSGVSMHDISFTNCRFNRDGFGTMSGGSGSAPEFAAVKVSGSGSSTRIGYISFTNCITAEGQADDGGGSPAYTHPKYGIWLENTDYLSWHAGAISEGHTGGQYFGGTPGWGSNWRPSLLAAGPTGQAVLPVWSDNSSRPASVLAGNIGFNSGTGKFEGYTGSAWVALN